MCSSKVGYLEDRGDEHFDVVMFEEIRPFVMDEIDHETFDMTTVLILISHDHQFSVA